MKCNEKSKNGMRCHKEKAAILETACQNEKEKDVDNISLLPEKPYNQDVDNVSPIPAKSYNQDDDTESNTAINRSSKSDDDYNHSSNSDTSDLDETASKTEDYSFMDGSKLQRNTHSSSKEIV